MAIRELARTKPARSQRAVLPFILGPRLMPVMFCAAVGLSAIPASADPIRYNETTAGDIPNAPLSLTFDVGLNTVSGQYGYKDRNSDFDTFGFVVPEGTLLVGINYVYSTYYPLFMLGFGGWREIDDFIIQDYTWEFDVRSAAAATPEPSTATVLLLVTGLIVLAARLVPAQGATRVALIRSSGRARP
jgi:hypothetical protein